MRFNRRTRWDNKEHKRTNISSFIESNTTAGRRLHNARRGKFWCGQIVLCLMHLWSDRRARSAFHWERSTLTSMPAMCVDSIAKRTRDVNQEEDALSAWLIPTLSMRIIKNLALHFRLAYREVSCYGIEADSTQIMYVWACLARTRLR